MNKWRTSRKGSEVGTAYEIMTRALEHEMLHAPRTVPGVEWGARRWALI